MNNAYLVVLRELSIKRITLDVDSSVTTRWGKQQGTRVDYNPRNHGRASHHPLIAFVADCRMIANMDSFNLRNFWATEAALTATMPAYNLTSLFRQSTMRTSVQPTMATLRHQVFAAPAWCGDKNGPRADHYTVAMPRQRRAWFTGLWSSALDPPRIPDLTPHTF